MTAANNKKHPRLVLDLSARGKVHGLVLAGNCLVAK